MRKIIDKDLERLLRSHYTNTITISVPCSTLAYILGNLNYNLFKTNANVIQYVAFFQEKNIAKAIAELDHEVSNEQVVVIVSHAS